MLGYAELYKPLNTDNQVIIPALVAGVIEPDIETFCRAYGVRFYDLSDDHHFMADSTGTEILST